MPGDTKIGSAAMEQRTRFLHGAAGKRFRRRGRRGFLPLPFFLSSSASLPCHPQRPFPVILSVSEGSLPRAAGGFFAPAGLRMTGKSAGLRMTGKSAGPGMTGGPRFAAGRQRRGSAFLTAAGTPAARV